MNDNDVNENYEMLDNIKRMFLMQGSTIYIKSNQEAIEFLNYISEYLSVKFDGKDIIYKILEYTDGSGQVQHMNVSQSRLDKDVMVMVALTLTTNEDEEPYDLLSENGVLAYVYNVTAPDLSELGYTFYKKRNDKVVRIG